jgi:hypothetical protein
VNRGVLSVVGGALLLAAAAAIAAIHYSYEETARTIGAAFGALLIGFVLALVGRYIWLRLQKADKPVFSAGLVFAAGIVALVGALLAVRGDQHGNDEQRFAEANSAIEKCRGSQSDPLAAAPRGFAYATPPSQVQQRLRLLVEAAGLPANTYEAKMIHHGQVNLGAVIVAPGFGGDKLADFENGVREGAKEQPGFAVQDISLLGRDGLVVSGPGVAYVVLDAGCYVLLTASADRPTARSVASAVVRSQD